MAIALWGVGVGYYIDNFTVNPGRVGEYKNLSRRQYVEFMSILDQLGVAMKEHWQQQGRDEEPRMYTYAAGIIPYRFRECHVLDDGLVSYRHRFRDRPSGIRGSAHYVLTLVPRHGELIGQLGGLPKKFKLVKNFDFAFDGEEIQHFGCYYNQSPSNQRLPSFVDE